MAFATSVIIYLIVEIFFYLFHFSILILLFARKNTAFKGPFFNILRIVFVVDLLCFLTTITIQKISFISAMIPFVKENPYYAIICYNFATSWPVIQFSAHSLMAFNRFTLIWFPVKHYFLWRKNWYTPLLICIPCLQILWRFNEPAEYIFLSESTLTISLKNLSVMSLAYSILTGTYLFTTFLAAVFNVLAFIKFYFYKSSVFNIHVKEKHMLFMSLVALFTQLLRTTYNIQRMSFPADEKMTMFFNNIYPYLSDIFALSGSLSLFVLSSTTRKEYKMFYFSYKTSQVIVMSSQTKINQLQRS